MSAFRSELPPEAKAYLAAFDNWLHTTWKLSSLERPDEDAATQLKDSCFMALVGTRAPSAKCEGCDALIVRSGHAGRPRKYCTTCRPSRSRNG